MPKTSRALNFLTESVLVVNSVPFCPFCLFQWGIGPCLCHVEKVSHGVEQVLTVSNGKLSLAKKPVSALSQLRGAFSPQALKGGL